MLTISIGAGIIIMNYFFKGKQLIQYKKINHHKNQYLINTNMPLTFF